MKTVVYYTKNDALKLAVQTMQDANIDKDVIAIVQGLIKKDTAKTTQATLQRMYEYLVTHGTSTVRDIVASEEYEDSTSGSIVALLRKLVQLGYVTKEPSVSETGKVGANAYTAVQ